jgi:hypothetical protein
MRTKQGSYPAPAPEKAARLKDKRVCGLPEDEDLWIIGRGFIVRDILDEEIARKLV